MSDEEKTKKPAPDYLHPLPQELFSYIARVLEHLNKMPVEDNFGVDAIEITWFDEVVGHCFQSEAHNGYDFAFVEGMLG
jgi:hypothetical protein